MIEKHAALAGLAQAAKTILIYGSDDRLIDKIVRNQAATTVIHTSPVQGCAYDLVVYNTTTCNNFAKTIEVLSNDSNVFFVDYNSINNKLVIENIIDNNAANFQTSRQMLVNGKRQEYLKIKYNRMPKKLSNRTDPITVFLVLKTGGDIYNSRYVNATANNIRANLTYPHELVCITDSYHGITSVDRLIKMRHDYPKWWGKIELFRDDVTKNSHCLFIDLDTVATKNIDNFCRLQGDFFGLRDFYTITTLQTGIMKWEVGEQSLSIYNKFVNTDFSKYINKGDHEWVGQTVKSYDFLQDCLPGELCSYKKDLSYLCKNLKDPSLICFHGDPRPHTITHEFITKHWKY